MAITAASNTPDLSTFGCFALVTYLPNPLGPFLTNLRQMLPGVTHPEAHITFLPPRQLPISAQDASFEIKQKLQSVKPFEIELGFVRMFPKTNIVYLSIEDGYQDILSLHKTLNLGSLFAVEDFEFIPHLTLGGPVDSSEAPDAMLAADATWSQCKLDRRFTVTEAVFLWQPSNCAASEWTRVASHPLPSR